VRRLVANAASFEEIREGILELYPEMDAEAISETLTDAMAAAFNRGRASVK
jgi:phage gp29-like protein